MNPIVYIGLRNSNDCNCEYDGWRGWVMGHEYINPRMEHNVLIVDDLTGGFKNTRRRLDCYHIDRPTAYSYVNLTFKFKNGEELTGKEYLDNLIKYISNYNNYNDFLEALRSAQKQICILSDEEEKVLSRVEKKIDFFRDCSCGYEDISEKRYNHLEKFIDNSITFLSIKIRSIYFVISI